MHVFTWLLLVRAVLIVRGATKELLYELRQRVLVLGAKIAGEATIRKLVKCTCNVLSSPCHVDRGSNV